MSEHVTDRIADLLEGHLRAEEVQAIEAHLIHCADCSDDVALAKQLREEVLEHALRHLSPERIVDFSSGTGEVLSPLEERHLSSCADCAGEIEWSRRQPDLETVLPDNATTSRPAKLVRSRQPTWWSWHRPWAWVGAAAAATALISWLYIAGKPVQERDLSQLSRLARIEPLPVQTTRSPAEPDSFEESRMLGLEAYAAGDFAAASQQLQRAAALRPDNDEVLLYLGSARLQTAGGEAAIALLDQVAQRTPDRTILAEALWLVANARLAQGNSTAALAALERLTALEERHAAEARALLQSVRNVASEPRTTPR